MLGRPTAGDTIGVYYHLLWSDQKREFLESPKFINGKRYIIFLRSRSRRTDCAGAQKPLFPQVDSHRGSASTVPEPSPEPFRPRSLSSTHAAKRDGD